MKNPMVGGDEGAGDQTVKTAMAWEAHPLEARA